MADFSDPRYASYHEICREAAVERKPQDGDYFVQFEGDRKPVLKGPIVLPLWRVGPWPDIEEYGFSEYWLPTLADWVEMLRTMGVRRITIEYLPESPEDPEEVSVSAKDTVGLGPTEEAAAARLWMGVK